MTFRCARHFFLTRKESMIFEGMTFVVLVTGFSNFACFFWLQNREWLSLHKALLFPSGMSFRTTKERMTFCCIRHHFLLLCMSFLTKSGFHFVLHQTTSCIRHLSCMSFLTTFRCIRHYHFFLCMSFLTTKCHFRSCMSFLITKSGDDSSLHAPLSFPFYKRVNDI